eukprot:7391618-Prymnesium_polylepis.1
MSALYGRCFAISATSASSPPNRAALGLHVKMRRSRTADGGSSAAGRLLDDADGPVGSMLSDDRLEADIGGGCFAGSSNCTSRSCDAREAALCPGQILPISDGDRPRAESPSSSKRSESWQSQPSTPVGTRLGVMNRPLRGSFMKPGASSRSIRELPSSGVLTGEGEPPLEAGESVAADGEVSCVSRGATAESA